jgi:F-type H+-transporting ATPase subunit delta
VSADSIASVYAQALLEAGKSRGDLSDLSQRAEWLLALWQETPRLQAFFSHPGIEKKEKHAFLKRCFFNDIPEELFRNFLSVLVDKNRLGHLESILKAFQENVDLENGIQRARVYSALTLDSVAREEIATALSKRFSGNVILDEELDPSLIGGIRIVVGDQVFDGSCQNYLKTLALRLDDLPLTEKVWEN